MDAQFRAHFYAGRPGDLVERALAGHETAFGPDEVPFVIASLAAIGQLGEAEVLLRNQSDSLSSAALVFAHVHLASAAAAAGRYAPARRHLGRAARLRNASSDGEALFYLYYGLAQYRFATGRLKLALMECHRAGAFLKRTGHDYHAALWHELIGHLQILTGDLRGGLAHLDAAAKYATTLDRQDQLRQLATVRVLYEARYARKPKDAAALLRSQIASRPFDDRFARASLQLELCRQQLLRRRIDDARAAFEEAVMASLGAAGRRYEITASLRMVDLHLASGAQIEAFLTLQSLEKLLDTEADDLLALELQARRAAVLERLVTPKTASPALAKALRDARTRYAELERRTGYVRPNEPKVKTRTPDPGLNHRQVALLGELSDSQSIDVQIYKKKYGVSEITACRDLAQLARGGYLVRLGKARATRYLKPQAAQAPSH